MLLLLPFAAAFSQKYVAPFPVDIVFAGFKIPTRLLKHQIMLFMEDFNQSFAIMYPFLKIIITRQLTVFWSF